MEAHPHSPEPRWHASIAVIAAIVLYVTLPTKITFGPLWLMPLLVALLLVPLLALSPRRQETPHQRWLSIALIATLNVFNLATLVELLLEVLSSHHVRQPVTGTSLLVAAVQIWLTNVIVFGLWFWEIDSGGPRARAKCVPGRFNRRADFLFPQFTLSDEAQLHLNWQPKVLDYVFLAFTNASAFSPADTFPLTRRAKVLMMMESFTSLVTLAIIASRAVGILA